VGGILGLVLSSSSSSRSTGRLLRAMVVSASRSASGEGELAVGFEREVGGLDCDARAVLVLAMVLGWTVMKGLDCDLERCRLDCAT